MTKECLYLSKQVETWVLAHTSQTLHDNPCKKPIS